MYVLCMCHARARLTSTMRARAQFVFLTVAANTMALTFHFTLVSHARIVFKTANQPFPDRKFDVFVALSVSLLTGPFIFGMVPGSSYSQTNAVTYNTFIAVSIALIPAQLFVSGPVLFRVTSQLIDSIITTRRNAEAIGQNGGDSSDQRSSKDSAPPRSRGGAGGRNSKDDSGSADRKQPTKVSLQIDRLLWRLRVFRFFFVFIVVPSEVVFCVLIACLYAIWRLPFLWVVHAALLVILLSCNMLVVRASSQMGMPTWAQCCPTRGGATVPSREGGNSAPTSKESSAVNASAKNNTALSTYQSSIVS